uniref:DUF38 domain-containing protein n=1 Tax=Panagrolaimus davidi TaxID=227884 RepID=A0A914P554_9BILA
MRHCKFCDSETHGSNNCDKYISDESRKEIADKNKFCRFCFVISLNEHLKEENECKSNESCMKWNSTEHHAIFCPERFKALHLFIPKIDENLLPRFLDIFDFDEKRLFALSSPTNDLLPLKQIIIMDSFSSKKITKVSTSETTVLNHLMDFIGYDIEKDKLILNAMNSKILICFPRMIFIRDSKLSSEMLLQILSPCTKGFNFHGSNCNPNISFSEIIQKAPNLEYVSIINFERNIQIGNEWINELLKYSKRKNFQFLRIKLDTIEEFDIEKLKKFVKTKCSKDVTISINYNQKLINGEDDGKEEWKKLDQFSQKLLKHFDDFYAVCSKDHHPCLNIGFEGTAGNRPFSLKNAFK